MDNLESHIIFGECATLQDAEEFIAHKEDCEGWKCLIRPFPYTFKYVMATDTPTRIMFKVPASWSFILHRF